MKLHAADLKSAVASIYARFDHNRARIAVVMAFAGLIFSLVVGAGYRGQVLKEKFHYQIGNMAWVLSMASTYTKAPGLYNANEAANIVKQPEEYVYTSRANHKLATSSMRTDVGYPLLVRFMLNDNIKGVETIAWHMARYQMMADLLVIVVLFFAGYRSFGLTCGVLAAFFYAVFRIPMVQMSFVEYYYWPVPLSALSLLGLTFIFGDQRNDETVSRKTWIIFFAFGLLIGFATYIRLLFFNLTFVLLPLVLLREYYLQKTLLLLPFKNLIVPVLRNVLKLSAAILLGQMVFALPIYMYNKKCHGKFALSDRQFWHLPLQGIGLYKNDWGIKDSGDVSINEWAMERGAPSYMGQPPDVLEKAEQWHKNKYFELVRENPGFFWNNFKTNFSRGLTVNEADFRFYGLFAAGGKMYKWFTGVFPWLVLSAVVLIALVFRQKRCFLFAVILQGLYFLLIIVTWFMNHTNFMTGYIPVFIFLLAASLTIYIKVVRASVESLIHCWLSGSFTFENFSKEFRVTISSSSAGN